MLGLWYDSVGVMVGLCWAYGKVYQYRIYISQIEHFLSADSKSEPLSVALWFSALLASPFLHPIGSHDYAQTQKAESGLTAIKRWKKSTDSSTKAATTEPV